MRLVTDTLIDGRYRVVERLGVGGMADVYLADDTHLGRQVALKILHSRFAEDREFVERFRREASAAAGLQHPNVVSVYDRGNYGETYYIAMEYLQGRTLSELIEGGPLPLEQTISIVGQILAAARFAHRRGVIHRDLKPHNVIVDDEGRAKVADFGIARAGASDMTQTGSVMGTAHYLSPEQAQGLEVTACSDLYSIGVILYQCLTGRVPFEGDSAVAVALKQVSEEPLPPSAVSPALPPGLDAVVLRALAKDPALRFQAADEFLEELEVAAHGGEPGQQTAAFRPVPGAAPSTSTMVGAPPVPSATPAERRGVPWRWVAPLVVLAMLVAVVAFILTRPDQVTVPSVLGQRLAIATRALEERGLEVDVRFVENDADRDTVLEQDPTPGRRTDEGETIVLTVSEGPPIVEVPPVRNLPTRRARRRLERIGFEVEITARYDQDIERGRAIGTQPARGTDLLRRSNVTLIVSRGIERVEVPDVTGLDQRDAESRLRARGLVPQVRERRSDRPEGRVIEQSPAAGRRIERDSTVTIVVSTGEREVRVPEVQGRSIEEATAILRRRGLSVSRRFRTVTDPNDDGKVVDQFPGPGSDARRGDTVSLAVGRYEEPSSPPAGAIEVG